MQCNALIPKKLQCQHEITVPCNKYNLHYDCIVVVEVELPCLHAFSVKCRDWMWMKEIRCKVSVPLLMPCGKMIPFICSEGPYHSDCIATVLKCGHRVPCYTDVDKYQCEVPVKCILPCFHETCVPCVLYYFSEKLKVAREMGPVQTVLQKLCGKTCNVLLECGHRCLGKCGDCTYDRKHPKCCELVTHDLPCGHRIQCKCHVKHLYCSERCNFLMDCSHRCSGICGICISTEMHLDCSELVRVVSPCGHQIETECHVKNPVCKVRCAAVLSCGHCCPGKCGKCFSLQIHSMCSELVNRQLPCGHCVKWPCGSPLPVCEKRCLFGCQHSRCINWCLHPCIKCPQPCDWKCEHLACSALCSDPCNRQPCDVRCPNILPCGHQCCGYCGEPCPNLCVLCDGVSISHTHGGSNWYVLLENCQHSIIAEDLNTYFAQKSKTSCPVCPECGTVITRNKRFGNCMKFWLSSNRHSSESYADILSDSDYYMLDTFISEMIEKNISLEFIPRTAKMCLNIRILQWITRKYSVLICDGLEGDIRSLKKWFPKHSAICSEQQVEESSRAVRRLYVLCHLKDAMAREPELKNSDHYCSVLLTILKSKPFGENEEKEIIDVLQENSMKEIGEKNYAVVLLRSIRDFSNAQATADIGRDLYFPKD